MKKKDPSIIIIGAGFAGLGAGIYARMNGYRTRIFEMHDQPGGLCTAWERKGYTFDGCIHWLVGSSPDSGIHDLWRETGIAKGRTFIDLDEYGRFEGPDGRTVVFYTDADRLEKHLLEFSPQDEPVIREFIRGIRMCIPLDFPSDHDSLPVRWRKKAAVTARFIRYGKKMKEWMNITGEEFSKKFKDPLLREAFREIWIPEFSVLFMLFMFSYMHNRNAGYPIGGSRPMSDALEARYRELGGEISYRSRVVKIITRDGKAVGVRLEDGREHLAGRVISAADGHTTLFSMLDQKGADEKSREPYEKWPLFPSLLFVSLGVNRSFENEPRTISGFTFRLDRPVEIGDAVRENLNVRIYNQDPTLAPEGKTAVTLMMPSDYDYWKKLAGDRKAYERKKEEIVHTVTELLEQRFPGLSRQVEVTDVATPLTFERYTGNWKGSFEGWLITPQNAGVMMKPMRQTLPGLKNFYMCGQWVEPGGGLPTAIMSARRLLKTICREDRKKFTTRMD